MILAKHGQTTESIIFVRPSDPLRETWDGRRLGVANAPQKLQLDRAFSIEDFHTELPKILAKVLHFIMLTHFTLGAMHY